MTPAISRPKRRTRSTRAGNPIDLDKVAPEGLICFRSVAGRIDRMLRNVIASMLLLAASTGVVPAGEIRVLAAIAMQGPLDRFAQAFTRATGHKVNIGYGLTGPIVAD